MPSSAPGDRGVYRAAGCDAHRPLHRGRERPNRRRPQLKQALHLAKVTGATLVIAKLDRLSRIAAFLLMLRDSGVRFSAVDLPEANDLTVGIMALVAQQEREAISRRTREALSVARSRGVKLGNPNGAEALRRAGKGGAPLREAISRNADRHARDLEPVVRPRLCSTIAGNPASAPGGPDAEPRAPASMGHLRRHVWGALVSGCTAALKLSAAAPVLLCYKVSAGIDLRLNQAPPCWPSEPNVPAAE